MATDGGTRAAAIERAADAGFMLGEKLRAAYQEPPFWILCNSNSTNTNAR